MSENKSSLPPLVLFAHGKESGPWGSKITALADIARRLGASVLSPDYSGIASPDARVEQLLVTDLPPHGVLVLVGSSMGGYVSTMASAVLRPKGLFLLAPAFGMPGYRVADPQPVADQVCVVHGWRDDIIPPAHSIRFAEKHKAEIYLLDGDHRLNANLAEIGWLFEGFLTRRFEQGHQGSDLYPTTPCAIHVPGGRPKSPSTAETN